MASRPFPAALASALSAANVTPLYFGQFDFAGGTLRLHTGLGTLSWGGNDWTGAGDLASIDHVEEGMALSPYALRLMLSGINSQVSSEAMGENYYRRPVTLYLGALNAEFQLVSTPAEIFFGFIEDMPVSIGGSDGDKILCTVESELAIFDRPGNLRYTQAQLEADYPGDKGLEYLEYMVDVRPIWRGQRQSFGGRGTTSSGNLTINPGGNFGGL